MRNITRHGLYALIALGALGLILRAGGSNAAAQTIWYVDADASTGGDGTNWSKAYKHLQDALHASLSSGDEIRVAGGTYFPDEDEGDNVSANDRSATFAMVDGTSLKGGYRGQSGAPGNENVRDETTTLSGDIDGDGLYLPHDGADEENSFSVVTAATLADTTTLDGLTITMGSAAGWPVLHDCPSCVDPDEETAGAAVFIQCCMDVQIKDCTIKDNFVTYSGAGVHCNRAVVTIEDSTFDNNLAQMYGGAVFHNGIHRTEACMDEIDSKITISGCTFTNNRAPYAPVYSDYEAWWPADPDAKGTGNGGAIAIEGAVEVTINSSVSNVTTFTDNYARRKAGALALFTRGEPDEHLDIAKISDVVFDSNGDWLFDVDGDGDTDDLKVSYGGGAWAKNVLGTEDLGQGPVEYTMFQDCTFKNNVVEKRGGGLWLDSLGGLQDSVVNLDGCTFLRNSQSGTGGAFMGGGAIFVGPRQDAGVFGKITGTWTNCTFIENDGLRGGAVYVRSTQTIEIGVSMFIRNSSGEGGGAICVSDKIDVGDTVLLLCNTDFISNTADEKGGAVYNRLGSKTTMVNCIVAGNTADDFGGGTCNADDGVIPPGALTEFNLHNCLLAGNLADTAFNLGGGHLNRDGGESTLINCTVVLNEAFDDFGGIENASDAGTMKVQNCIVWGNSDDAANGADDQLHFSGDDPVDKEVDKNVVEDCTGACFPGTGNANKGDDPVVINTDAVSWTGCTFDPDTGTVLFEMEDDVSELVTLAPRHFFQPDNDSPLQLLVKSVDAVNDTITCYGWWTNPHIGLGDSGTIYDYHIATGSSAIDFGDVNHLPLDDCDLNGLFGTTDTLPLDLDLNDRREQSSNPDSGAYEIE